MKKLKLEKFQVSKLSDKASIKGGLVADEKLSTTNFNAFTICTIPATADLDVDKDSCINTSKDFSSPVLNTGV